MNMLDRRICAYNVFMKLNNSGYKLPCEDRSRINYLRWKISYKLEWLKLHYCNNLTLPMIVIHTNTNCTLKCKYCGNYIPYIKEKRFYKFDNFRRDLDTLCASVSFIYNLIFPGGGEPLIMPKFHEFVDYAASKHNILSITITTNGTVVPKEKLISVIKKHSNKINIQLSDYSGTVHAGKKAYTNDQYQKVADVFRENIPGISIVNNRPVWLKSSFPKFNYRTLAERKQYLLDCLNTHGAFYTSIWEGKLYVCPRPYLMSLQGIVISKNDYLDISNYTDPFVLRHDLLQFYSREYYNCCDYCNNNEDAKNDYIIPGEQL